MIFAIPFSYPPENMTGIVPFISYVNTLVDGFLGVAILIIVGFIAFLSTKGYSTDRALGYSTFLLLITSLFLRFLSLINDAVLLIVIVLFIIAVIFLMRERNVESFGT